MVPHVACMVRSFPGPLSLGTVQSSRHPCREPQAAARYFSLFFLFSSTCFEAAQSGIVFSCKFSFAAFFNSSVSWTCPKRRILSQSARDQISKCVWERL